MTEVLTLMAEVLTIICVYILLPSRGTKIFGAITLMILIMCTSGALLIKHHNHVMSIWKQKDKDFPYDKRYDQLTQPLALVSTTNHFMLLAPKGKLVLYCMENGCIGSNKKEMQETISELFADLATQNRKNQAQQKPAAPPKSILPQGAKK